MKAFFREGGSLFMSRGMQWMSLLGGSFLSLFGLMKLYQEADWVLLVLGLLIVGFTISNMTKSRQVGKGV
jgi:hypothetical protein